MKSMVVVINASPILRLMSDCLTNFFFFLVNYCFKQIEIPLRKHRINELKVHKMIPHLFCTTLQNNLPQNLLKSNSNSQIV